MNANVLTKATDILKKAGCTEVYLFGSQATGVINYKRFLIQSYERQPMAA